MFHKRVEQSCCPCGYDLAGLGDLVHGGLGPGDLDEHGRARLSYSQAEDLWKQWTAALLGEAKTLHQLRHSALTHDAEDGWDVTMLKTKSGHTSLRSLERYARPSTEALARMQ